MIHVAHAILMFGTVRQIMREFAMSEYVCCLDDEFSSLSATLASEFGQNFSYELVRAHGGFGKKVIATFREEGSDYLLERRDS